MNQAVQLRLVARQEFDEATDWYESRCVGLGERFVAAVQRVFDAAAANPDRYPRVRGEIREGLVLGFPYAVYFRAEPDQIIVLAVFHAAREPRDWQSRQ